MNISDNERRVYIPKFTPKAVEEINRNNYKDFQNPNNLEKGNSNFQELLNTSDIKDKVFGRIPITEITYTNNNPSLKILNSIKMYKGEGQEITDYDYTSIPVKELIGNYNKTLKSYTVMDKNDQNTKINLSEDITLYDTYNNSKGDLKTLLKLSV